MRRSKRYMTKDDTSLRQLVEEAEAVGNGRCAVPHLLGLERKPPDFKAATEFALSRLAAMAHAEPETIEVTLRLVNGQPQFEPSDKIRTQGNELYVGDKRIVVGGGVKRPNRFYSQRDTSHGQVSVLEGVLNMSAIPDLWPEDVAEPGDLRPPVVILREQAGLLGTKTKNIVEATVASWGSAEEFEHHFKLVAPAFNYVYRLFAVRHDARLYPATVVWLDQEHKVNSEDELLAKLREIFSSEETRRVINVLMAQSQG